MVKILKKNEKFKKKLKRQFHLHQLKMLNLTQLLTFSHTIH